MPLALQVARPVPIQLLDASPGKSKPIDPDMPRAPPRRARPRRLRLGRRGRRRRREGNRDQGGCGLRRLATVRPSAGADALPADRRAAAGPAAEAGVVDQHARADRVPAGDPRRGRLRDQQVRQRESDPAQRSQGALGNPDPAQRQRQTQFRHRAGLPPGPPLRSLPRRPPRRRRRRDRPQGLGAQARRPPRILPLGRRRHALPRHRHHRPAGAADHGWQHPLELQRARRDQSQPQLPRRPRLLRRLRELDVRARRRQRQADLADQHEQGRALRPRRLLLLPRDRLRQGLRRPRRRHRLRLRRKDRQGRAGPSTPAARSTAPPPSPRSPGPSRPSTSAPKTGASTRSTPPPARSPGATTSAARSPVPRW